MFHVKHKYRILKMKDENVSRETLFHVKLDIDLTIYYTNFLPFGLSNWNWQDWQICQLQIEPKKLL